MQPNIKHGLLIESNSVVKDSQLQAIICRDQAITDHYVLDKDYFARGKFANVHRIRHKQTGQVYAAKFLKKRRLRFGNVTDEILHEIRVLLTASTCDRIVHLHQVFETANEYILVLELAEGGELHVVLEEDECINETSCRKILRQIVEGVLFLHSHQIAHLDIKPQNILLTKKLPEGDVKLCDFGISRVISSNYEIREIMGTTDYMPPEVLQYEPITLASDMWSIGVLAYVLLSGHSPFGDDDKFCTYSNITSSELEFPDKLFSSVSDCAKDFICKLLVRNSKKRMTCQECLQHEWLSTSKVPINCDQHKIVELVEEVVQVIAVGNDNEHLRTEVVSEDSGVSTPTLPDIIITNSHHNASELQDDDNQSSASISSLSSVGSSLDPVTTNDIDTQAINCLTNIKSDCDNTQTGQLNTVLAQNFVHDSRLFREDKMDLEDCDKENCKQNDNSSTNATLPYPKQHKRLSSDIYSDRKLIAVVSEMSLKKYTSESSMSTVCGGGNNSSDTNNNQISEQHQSSSQFVPFSLSTSSLTNNSQFECITSSSSSTDVCNETSPPSTPRKKFYLSNDDTTIGESNNKSEALSNINNRIRSVSMERINDQCNLSTSTHTFATSTIMSCSKENGSMNIKSTFHQTMMDNFEIFSSQASNL